MRIAIVGNFSLTGKQTMALRALPMAERLAARGHSICLCLPLRRGDRGEVRGVPRGVGVVHAGRGPRVPGLVQLWQLLSLFIFCWRWRPDILYCFKPIAHAGGVLALFHMLRRIGLYQGALALDTDDWEGEGGWNELQPFPGWLKKFISLQEAWSLGHADVVTVASRTLLLAAKRSGSHHAVYVPNAVSPLSVSLVPVSNPSLRADLGLGSRPVLLLYTRFVEFHVPRVLDLLEATIQLAGDGVLLVVGKGLRGEEKQLQQLAGERGLASRVIYAGWVQQEELPNYFAAADVALYPLDDNLLNRTKCPVKLLDLLAFGVPVVADAVGQAAEYVENGRTGILVKPGDVAAMARAVVDLLSDATHRAELGDTARRVARSHWSWETWSLEVERALELSLSQCTSRHERTTAGK